MATIVTPALSADNPTARLGIVIDPYDYYDFTNQKSKSGIFTITINSVTWTGSGLTDQLMRADARVPNYNEVNDSPVIDDQQVELDGEEAALTPDLSAYYVAWNSGVRGPSSLLQSDGQVELLDFAFALDPLTTATNVVVTVDYTLAFTQKTFDYTDTPDNTVTLTVDPFKAQDWFYILPDSTDIASKKAVSVQLLTVSGVHTGSVDDGEMPVFAANNVPGLGGGSVTLANHNLPALSKFSRKYPDGGFVFAINDGKVDANATRSLGANTSTETQRFSLFSFLLSKTGADTPGTTTLDVNYKLTMTSVS